jgi:hypothetical protein
MCTTSDLPDDESDLLLCDKLVLTGKPAAKPESQLG